MGRCACGKDTGWFGGGECGPCYEARKKKEAQEVELKFRAEYQTGCSGGQPHKIKSVLVRVWEGDFWVVIKREHCENAGCNFFREIYLG